MSDMTAPLTPTSAAAYLAVHRPGMTVRPEAKDHTLVNASLGLVRLAALAGHQVTLLDAMNALLALRAQARHQWQGVAA